MNFQYVSINSIFTKLIRDTTSEFSEDDVIEWSGEALEFIGAVRAYEEAIAFIEIKNHQGKLPLGLHQIIQVARNNNYNNYKQTTPAVVTSSTVLTSPSPALINLTAEQPWDAVWIDESGQPIVAYDLAYYRPFFDLRTEHIPFFGSNYYRQHFSPVRLANHTLFGTLVARENGVAYRHCVDQYSIILKNTIRTSFKEGQLCLAYYRQVRDVETGYPMIPDEVSYKTAITKYITMKIFEREFYSGRDGAQVKYSKAEDDWQWYCRQAGDKSMMITGIDEHQNLLDQRLTLIPNLNKYYGFFGNLSKPEIGYPIIYRNEDYTDTTMPIVSYWTAKDTNTLPTLSEILEWTVVDINSGQTASVPFETVNTTPKYLFYAELLTEPIKTIYYFSDDDKGSIGGYGPWAEPVTIGNTYRVYITNYKTQTDNLPIQFKTE